MVDLLDILPGHRRKKKEIAQLAQQALDLETAQMRLCMESLKPFAKIESDTGFTNHIIGQNGRGYLHIHPNAAASFVPTVDGIIKKVLDVRAASADLASLSRRIEAGLMLLRDSSPSGKRAEVLSEEERRVLFFGRSVPVRVNKVVLSLRWLISHSHGFSSKGGYAEVFDMAEAKTACVKLVEAKQGIMSLLEDLKKLNELELEVRNKVLEWASQRAA